jgi:hypothetical protein
MINKSGLSGALNNLNPKSPTSGKLNTGTNIVGRVTDIILDENHPRYAEVGLGTNGIGVIFFEPVGVDNAGIERIAKPYLPNIKSYPLINELVYCFYLPTPTLGASSNFKREYYFLTSVNTWSNPHFNALPPTINKILKETSKINSYQQTELGVTQINNPQNPTLNPNNPINPSQDTFVEKSNIHPLMPFAGDILHEGRFGNSLRFGNTSKSKSQYANNWSKSGENGDPITILRNGQPSNTSNEGWIPITEDVKNDLSSIWLTSTQKIPFSLSNENFNSYSTPPITPSSFTLPQIILYSDRVTLNAKSDSVLISGQKSVGLSSNGSINVEAKQIYFDGNDIRLGSKDASQSVLKGDDTVELLKRLTTELLNISTALKTQQIFPGGVPSPDPVVGPVANIAASNLNTILQQIDSVKSNFVKTI